MPPGDADLIFAAKLNGWFGQTNILLAEYVQLANELTENIGLVADLLTMTLKKTSFKQVPISLLLRYLRRRTANNCAPSSIGTKVMSPVLGSNVNVLLVWKGLLVKLSGGVLVVKGIVYVLPLQLRDDGARGLTISDAIESPFISYGEQL
jgi:hypothetical protein